MSGKKTGLESKYKNLFKTIGVFPAVKNKKTISINPMLDDMQKGMGAPGMFLARRALLTKGAANMVKPKPTVGKKVLEPKKIKSKSGAAKFEKTMKKGLKIPGYNSGGSMSKDRLTQKDVEAATKALTYQRAVKNNKDKDRLTQKDVEAAAKAVGYLTGGQAKIDANKDGKITGKDFKILKAKKKKKKSGKA